MNKISLHSLAALIASLICLSAATRTAEAQNQNREKLGEYQRNIYRKMILIPDIPGYITLKGDFHIHTIFSDGEVWPGTRVKEAWREGLDVIAITDHLEYRPHGKYHDIDPNLPYEIAAPGAEMKNIILIRGTEITRSMPPGHFNAIFLEDVSPVETDDPMAQIEAANKQGAFVMWNHPGWAGQQKDTTLWWDFHTEILEKGWLHGIEVANEVEWYPVAVDWCREKELTVFANSDIHAPIDYFYDFNSQSDHRPITLVFSTSRSEEGVKEALFSRRTLAWSDDLLMGSEELIKALFKASVSVEPPYTSKISGGKSKDYMEILNPTDLTFILRQKTGNDVGRIIHLEPRSETIYSTPSGEESNQFELLNCRTGGREHPVITLSVH